MKQWLKYQYQRVFNTPMYVGPFANWQAASAQCQGYTDTVILEATHRAMQKVLAGQAFLERDGEAILSPKFRDPLISSLLYIANQADGALRVLDIGGALGSLYHQCRYWLQDKKIDWTVAEQTHVAEFGQKHYGTDELQFVDNIFTLAPNFQADVVILSSSLQYFAKPHDLVDKLLQHQIPYFIYDRLPFSSCAQAKVMLQNAHTSQYKTCYPVWILNESALKEQLQGQYRCFAEYNIEEKDIIINAQERVYFAGALWRIHE